MTKVTTRYGAFFLGSSEKVYMVDVRDLPESCPVRKVDMHFEFNPDLSRSSLYEIALAIEEEGRTMFSSQEEERQKFVQWVKDNESEANASLAASRITSIDQQIAELQAFRDEQSYAVDCWEEEKAEASPQTVASS